MMEELIGCHLMKHERCMRKVKPYGEVKNMCEPLTAFIPKFTHLHHGDQMIDTENDGSAEHPI